MSRTRGVSRRVRGRRRADAGGFTCVRVIGATLALVTVTLMTAGVFFVQIPGTVRAQGDVQLTTDPEADTQPDWSPDGSTVLFTRRPEVGCCEGKLWTMDANGSNQTQFSSGTLDESGTYSPDGRTIAFSHWPSSRGDYGDVMLMNSDGTGIVELTPGGTFSYDAAQWSGDGTRLVGHAIDGTTGGPHVGTHRLWTVDADGSNFAVVLFRGYYPMFLPGDNEVLFVDHDYDETIFRLAVLTLGTGTVAPLTPGPYDVLPDVSPDGTKVVFSRCLAYPVPAPSCDVYLMDRLGQRYERLTSDGAGNTYPRFSPDGTKIVYVSTRSGNRDIWVHQLPASPAATFSLSASPSVRSVVAGGTTDYAVFVKAEGDFSAVVTLTSSVERSGVSFEFTPGAAVPSALSTLSVSVASDVPPGEYTLNIRGTGGGVEKTATARLVVRSPEAASIAVNLWWILLAFAVLLGLLLFVAYRRRREPDVSPPPPPSPAPEVTGQPGGQRLGGQEKLALLEERLARGEVSESLYRDLRQKYEEESAKEG